jgi:hypothetical protein
VQASVRIFRNPTREVVSVTQLVWEILFVVAGAGAVGGVVNALLSDNGDIALPTLEQGILRLGVLGNLLLGAFAAVISWGLYGPLKDAVILGSPSPDGVTPNLTVTALVGAALAGAGGARVITNEIDKRFLQKAATHMAGKQPSSDLVARVATASPVEASQLAAAAP